MKTAAQVTDPQRLNEMEAEVRALLQAHLGIEKPTLAQGLRAVGRGLPKRQRANGARLVEALEKVAHPRLYAQLDAQALEKAHAGLVRYLESVDLAEVKLRRRLRLASGLAFNLLLLVAGVIVLLRLRGFV